MVKSVAGAYDEMNPERLPEYIQFLMNADVYPHPVDEVRLLQTHISFVVLAGPFVYKWKKPVDFGFLNFSTLARRRYYCGQELLLNRRLCPDNVYLDLVGLTCDDGVYGLGGRGRKVEYGVKMARLPEERMMNRLIRKGEVDGHDIDRIVTRLVPFYERSESSSKVTGFGSVREVGRSVMENFKQTAPYIGQTGLDRERFDRIRDFAAGFLAHRRLFERRMAEGRIRDCHGDLHTANICLADEVIIFDCIEFSRRLRCTDIAADVAFLAMDLDLHGLHNLSEYFIQRFMEASGDPGLLSMLGFYKCYRAYVRGKINLLTAVDPGVNPRTAGECRERAGSCFALAESYAGRSS